MWSFYMKTVLISLIVMVFHSSYCIRNRGSECPEMYKRTYEGYIPKGNDSAGNYTHLENITNLDDCVSKCCKNKTCNAAFMFNDQCYNLDCESNEKCTPKLHHNITLRDNVTLVLVRPDHKNDSWRNILESQDKKHENWKESCPKLYEFTYRGYLPRGNLSTGNFSYIEGISKFKKCILNCCDNDLCNVAIMHEKKCYNVHCKSSKSCIPILHHNITLRKSLKMVLVKPVNRREQWKEILERFKESEEDDDSEELLPEIASAEETTTMPTRIWQNLDKKLSDLNVKFHDWDRETKKLRIEWIQRDGPSKLDIVKNNETSFNIKNIIVGNYLVKLEITDEKAVNSTDNHHIEPTTEVESQTVTENATLERKSRKTV